MLLTMFFANADINSRVACSCPFYFWTAAAIFKIKNGKIAISDFIKLHNLIYILLNFVLFIVEQGFV